MNKAPVNPNLIYEMLDSSIQDALDILLQIQDVSIKIDPLGKKWSEKEILGHLIDSAINNYRRFLISHNENTLIFKGYSQDEWVQIRDYNQTNWDDIVSLWLSLNKHILRLVKRIPEMALFKEYKKSQSKFDRF